MDHYTLTGEFYLHPTPAGAYYAASRPGARSGARCSCSACCASPSHAQASPPSWCSEWMSDGRAGGPGLHLPAAGLRLHPGPADALSKCRPTRIEALLPPLLTQLSDEGKRALLAEKRGLYLATVGFAHETPRKNSRHWAPTWPSVHERHSEAVARQSCAWRSDGWGMVNAAGCQREWPSGRSIFGNDYLHPGGGRHAALQPGGLHDAGVDAGRALRRCGLIWRAHALDLELKT